MIHETARRAKTMTDQAITWTADQDTMGKPEHWQSHATRILADQTYRADDDCDGFALTCAELCIHFGIDPTDISIMLCEIPGVGFHLVCLVDDLELQTSWVLDNNERTPKHFTGVNLRWIKYMRYDNLGVWLNCEE